jgi:hypothetical protein
LHIDACAAQRLPHCESICVDHPGITVDIESHIPPHQQETTCQTGDQRHN